MELLFVIVIGACIGGIIRYALPRRGTYGILLLPAASAAVTGAVWAALVWAGFTFDGGWIWVISLVAGGLAGLILALAVPRQRIEQDARMLHTLTGGKA